jgi:hypothetical protein
VRFFEIVERSDSRGRSLHIDGLIFNSSLAVKSVESRLEGDAVIIEVSLIPTGKS